MVTVFRFKFQRRFSLNGMVCLYAESTISSLCSFVFHFRPPFITKCFALVKAGSFIMPKRWLMLEML